MEYETYNFPKTGFDDTYIWTLHKDWPNRSYVRWVRKFLISLIPFSGVGSIQPHIQIPLIFYLYLRNFTIIAFLLLLWIIVEFFVYSLFGVWDFGAYFDIDYKTIWRKKLRGEEIVFEGESEGEEEDEAEKTKRKRKKKPAKDTGDEESPLEEDEEGEGHTFPFGLGVSVMNAIRQRGLSDKTEQISLLLDDVGYTADPHDPDPVGVVITNLLYNIIFELVGVLFCMYAVRSFPLDTFGSGSNFTWELGVQMGIVFIPMAFHGAITAWVASLMVTILIWGAFVPWNTNGYSNFTIYVAGPYIFWSVINVYFTVVFSRIYARWGDTKLYPIPTDRRYFINAALGMGFAFWILSLIFTIVDA